MEATGNQGVAIKKWSNMKTSYGEYYARIVLRHLDHERTDANLELLGKFLKEVCGKSYSFRPRDLIRKDTMIKKPSGNVKAEDEKLVE